MGSEDNDRSEVRTIERTGLLGAVEQAADAILITGVDGAIQFANPAFAALTGYSPAEILGRNPSFLKSGQTPDETYADLWKIIRSGRVWHGEILNRRKDGSIYREDMRITPVKGPSGEIVSYIAVKRDVTGVRAESDARALLAAIVENSDCAIVAYSPAGAILTWNRAAERVFGFTAAQVIGQPVAMLAPPERRETQASITARVLAGQSIADHLGVGVCRDGRRIVLSVSGAAVRGSAGEISAISLILRDITAQREAERDRALLASIVESSDDAMFAMSMDGIVMSWNRGAEALCGYGREIVGQNAAILAAPGRAEKVFQYIHTILSGGAVTAHDTVLRTKA